MRKIAVILVMLAVSVLVACNTAIPTVVVVVTNTPDPNIIQVTITPAVPTTNGTAPTPTPATAVAAAPTTVVPPSPVQPTALPPTNTVPPTPAITNTPAPTATPNVFPTETRAQLYIAQQDFERGFMFWISTQKRVWILYTSPGNPNAGEWESFEDTWVEGKDPDLDASLTPPSTGLYQPRRGFGKIWRETPGLRDKLGWGTTPEFDLQTLYVYQPGGYVDPTNKWIPGPGKHFITALSRQTYSISEPAPGQRGKWERFG